MFFPNTGRVRSLLSLRFLTTSLTTDTPQVCVLLLLSPDSHHPLTVPTQLDSPVPPPLTSPETPAQTSYGWEEQTAQNRTVGCQSICPWLTQQEAAGGFGLPVGPHAF